MFVSRASKDMWLGFESVEVVVFYIYLYLLVSVGSLRRQIIKSYVFIILFSAVEHARIRVCTQQCQSKSSRLSPAQRVYTGLTSPVCTQQC